MNNCTRNNFYSQAASTYTQTSMSRGTYEPIAKLLMETAVLIATTSLYACATTIFFKKSFQRTSLPVAVNMVAMGLYISHHENRILMISTVISCFISAIVHRQKSIIAAKDVWSFVAFVPVYLDLKLNVSDSVAGGHGFVVMATVAAVAQFIRRPSWLKAKLQKLRSRLGPMYVLYVSAVSRQMVGLSLFRTSSWFDHVMGVLPGISMVTAIMAAFVYRPDNSEILENIVPGTSAKYRKNVHKVLMIVSFACFCGNVLYWNL